MHATPKRWLLLLALAVGAGQLNAQPPGAPRPQPAPDAPKQANRPPRPAGRIPTRGIPLPDGANLTVPTNTTERYSVAPLAFYEAPRSTREDVATVALVRPAEGHLPDSFTITTNEMISVTTIVLPLVSETGERFERRIEVLVVDEVSSAYKAYLESIIKQLFPTASVNVMIANAQTAVLNGYVDRAELVQPVENLVRGFLASRSGGAPDAVTVVNALRVTGGQQVQLKVLLAEVDRTKIRDLGFEFQWQDLSPPFTASLNNILGVQNFANSQNQNQAFTVSRAGIFQFNGFLRAVVQNNLGKILAQPILVTTSGQPAFFNVGGETPLLIPQGNNTISIEYRPFGTNLRFVPTVLGDGRIRLEVRPEVSELNPANGVTIGGTSVPGFDNRVVETTVELENGQTFAIAGLIQQRVSARTTKTPFLGDLPLVGWAWQNKSYNQSEIELLIMVTPHLAEPMNEQPCKLPGRESRIPNALEYYLGSKFEPPCFPDPYRADHYKKHYGEGNHMPQQTPVPPYDNYGRPRPPMTQLHPQTLPPTAATQPQPQLRTQPASIQPASLTQPASPAPVIQIPSAQPVVIPPEEAGLVPPPPASVQPTEAAGSPSPAANPPAEAAPAGAEPPAPAPVPGNAEESKPQPPAVRPLAEPVGIPR